MKITKKQRNLIITSTILITLIVATFVLGSQQADVEIPIESQFPIQDTTIVDTEPTVPEPTMDDINKDILLGAYTIATLEASTDEYKACGWITKRTIELCEQQGLKAYSGYIVTPLGEHLAPVIRLNDFTYFGYEQLEQIGNTSYTGKLIRYDYQPVPKIRVDVPKGAVYIPTQVIDSSPNIKIFLHYSGG